MPRRRRPARRILYDSSLLPFDRRLLLASGFESGGFFDDVRQHLAGFAAFGWSFRNPNVGCVGGEDVFEVALALHALRRELGDVNVASPFVSMLDQQPVPAVVARTA